MRARPPDVIAASPDRIVAALETGTMRVQGESLTPSNDGPSPPSLDVADDAGGERRRGSGGRSTVQASVRSAPPPPTGGRGRDAANDRFQKQPGFSSAQSANLKLKWAFGFDGENAGRQPDVVGDRVSSAADRARLRARFEGRLHALDVQGGRRRSSLDCCRRQPERLDRGLLRRHRAFVYSVDATTGSLLWKKQIDGHRAARVTGSPVLYGGRLYVPVSSVEEATGARATYECCTFRGSIVALDPATGAELWRTYMITETPTPRSKNAKGTQLWGPSGAAVWSAPTVDPMHEVAETSRPATRTDAGGADDRCDRRAGSGNRRAIRWVNQTTAVMRLRWRAAPPARPTARKEGPDHDFGQSPILVTLAGGKRVIVAGQKSGVVHGFDPDQGGKKLWSTTVGRGGALGGIEWGSASDGQNMYVPLSDIGFKDPKQYGRGGLNPEIGGGLFAIRIADGKQAWLSRPNACGDKPSCSPALSAPAAAIPGAVFGGSVDGHFRAFATGDGHILWDFDTARDFDTVNGVKARGGSIDVGGAAIANGMVLTTSGYGQWGGMRGNVLLAFSVDGK